MPTRYPSWRLLAEHYRATRTLHQRCRFAEDPQRFTQMHQGLHGLLFDYSRNRIGTDTLDLLCRLADEAGVAERREAMFAGGKINVSEGRAVLHTALRLPENAPPVYVDGENVLPAVFAERRRALAFAEDLLHGRYCPVAGRRVCDVVNIGIGGSDLGARMAVSALHRYRRNINVHFAANLDASELDGILAGLNPETTFFIVASKSFRTPETMLNAQAARRWLEQGGIAAADTARHFAAVSASVEAMHAFGVAPERQFFLADWVGGRYSVWSSVGLALMCAVGSEAFRAFLDGAYAMDCHFREAPHRRNIPVLMALIAVWNQNFHGIASHAVIPYHHGLRRFPAYLQQLDMESNGKSHTLNGEAAACATGVPVWGEEGSNCQHAFFQLMHQGSRAVSTDLILTMQPDVPPQDAGDTRHTLLVANALAQARAFMYGKTLEEARQQDGACAEYQVFEGDRPVNILALDRMSPYNLGMLAAAYEHKIFVQGLIWQINSFDQWGVEYGKAIARSLLPLLEDGEETDTDSATAGLAAYFRRCRAR